MEFPGVMTSIHNMLWFLKKQPNAVPPVDLDTDPEFWGTEGGEEERSDDDQPAASASEHLIPAAMAAKRLADQLTYSVGDLAWPRLDVPELGLVELHFDSRGSGIWYASLVDCEDGRILAVGRLHRR